MQKLLSSEQMRSADAFTIARKQISSLELMESASAAFVEAFTEEVTEQSAGISILCGKGNNGGDGLAIARMLRDKGYINVAVYLVQFSSKESPEYKANLNLLQRLGFELRLIRTPDDAAGLPDGLIIDAVLGSGLNKPLQGSYLALAEIVNGLSRRVIAVDVPTGFPAEGLLVKDSVYLKADLVICFQRPKINFFFPESAAALKRFRVVQIGLDEDFIQSCDSPYQLMDAMVIRSLVKPREAFTHKGTYGHALIVAGQKETMGAALLSAMACLHGGAGLTSLAIPESGLTALNTALPEVMYLDRTDLKTIDAKKFKAIAIGPGLGTGEEGLTLLKDLIGLKLPLIVDADALNILAAQKELTSQLTPGSILTPHMKEFDHLFGEHDSWWERLQTARTEAVKLKGVIILKNQYTFIINEIGEVTINQTGNPAMAQGGMGDVLTGLTASFSAQGYAAAEAACLACYLHGRSGDELADGQVSVTASALAQRVPLTLKGLII